MENLTNLGDEGWASTFHPVMRLAGSRESDQTGEPC